MDSDITSLLNNSNTNSSLSSSLLPDGFMPLFTAFMVVTIIVSIVIAVLYVMNMVITYRAHKAAIESRDILREMNERDKARSLPTTTT